MLNLKAVSSLHTFYPADCVSTHARVLCDMNGRQKKCFGLSSLISSAV